MPSFLERIKARKFSSAASNAVDIGVNGDTQARLAIDAGGKLLWGSGSTTGDANLYRESADVLKTDDDFKVAGKLSVTASSGDEGGEIFLAQAQTNTTLSGGITIDSYQNKIRFFEQGGSARGAYIDLTAAAGGAGTNLLSGGGGATTLDGLTDVTAPTPASGDYLKWNGTAWVNDTIDLGTDTSGNYMSGVTAGTGITVTHTPEEGSTATITNAGVTSVNGSTGAITGVVRTSDTGTVTSTMIADGTIVNADVNTSAAIAHSKLANATAGQVLLGTTTTGVITATALSGDVTVTGAGVTAIGSGVIVNADINSAAAIDLTKLSTTGASSGYVISYNGTAWAASDYAPSTTAIDGGTPSTVQFFNFGAVDAGGVS